jgi:hypothetical protein
MEKQRADLESDEFKWEYFLWSHHKNKWEFHTWLKSQGCEYTPNGPVHIRPIRRPAKRNPVTNPIIGDTK